MSNATLGKIADALRTAPIVEGVDLLLEPENKVPANGSEPAA